MVSLTQVLTAERTLIDDFGGSKKKVLQTLAERLSEALPDISVNELFDQLIARERLGSTGIGHGVAVPHCRLKGLSAPIALLAKLKQSIDYEAVDRQPVSILFALIVPEDATEAHLQLLASVVERFNDPATLAKLNQCQHEDELYTTFTAARS